MKNQNWVVNLMGKVADKLIDQVATVLALAVIGAVVGGWAIISTDQQAIIAVAFLFLIVLVILLAFVVFHLKSRHYRWGKSGNIYWLCRDLINTIGVLDDSQMTKNRIDHHLHQCHHHAQELEMTEMDILPRLSRIKDNARSLSQHEWTAERKADVSHSLISILNDVGTTAKERQPDFDPGTGLL